MTLFDARLHLLDRQILDQDGVPAGVVDDLELSGPAQGEPIPPGTAAPQVTAILTGVALPVRIFGGRAPLSRLGRIAWRDVASIGVAVQLSVAGADLDVLWAERWLRERIISRIPGGRHDPE